MILYLVEHGFPDFLFYATSWHVFRQYSFELESSVCPSLPWPAWTASRRAVQRPNSRVFSLHFVASNHHYASIAWGVRLTLFFLSVRLCSRIRHSTRLTPYLHGFHPSLPLRLPLLLLHQRALHLLSIAAICCPCSFSSSFQLRQTWRVCWTSHWQKREPTQSKYRLSQIQVSRCLCRTWSDERFTVPWRKPRRWDANSLLPNCAACYCLLSPSRLFSMHDQRKLPRWASMWRCKAAWRSKTRSFQPIFPILSPNCSTKCIPFLIGVRRSPKSSSKTSTTTWQSE